MPLPIDPGPLFKVEAVATARRWQTYVLRVVLVLALLATMYLVWLSHLQRQAGTGMTLRDYSAMGQFIAFALLTTQLAFIMLAAPAATAGAVCIDKARGNMTLLMASTLNSADIVLGKLWGRMLPVVGLIAVSIPVLFLASLLGGINLEIAAGGFAIIIGTALFTAATAFLFSIWVGKTHEALLLTYFVVFSWLLGYYVYDLALGWRGPANRWLYLQNPVGLLFAPLNPTNGVGLDDYLLFLATTVGCSALLVGIAISRIRRVVLNQSNQPVKRRRSWIRLPRSRAMHLLDKAPVRWYERHRKRPTRAGRLVNFLFVGSALVGGIWAAWELTKQTRGAIEFVPFFVMFQIGIGLLLTTVYAVTALAEERSRGNLDILLSTPVTTRDVVWAKWRSAFHSVLWLPVLPFLLGLMIAWIGPIRLIPGAVHRPGYLPLFLALLVLMPIASGAFLTSLGLYLATRTKQFGRAVGMAVGVNVLLSVAWPFMIAIFSPRDNTTVFFWMSGSPAIGPAFTFVVMLFEREETFILFFGGVFWSVLYLAITAALYLRTVSIFDRCMGRVSDRPRMRPRPLVTQRPRRGLGVEWVEPRGMP